jgi:hypothetical protein
LEPRRAEVPIDLGQCAIVSVAVDLADELAAVRVPELNRDEALRHAELDVHHQAARWRNS